VIEMIVIVEDADLVGKSTVTDRLSAERGWPIVTSAHDPDDVYRQVIEFLGIPDPCGAPGSAASARCPHQATETLKHGHIAGCRRGPADRWRGR
jgi:hypothetical protein